MKCWKCETELDFPDSRTLPFRAECEKCHAWQHCCKNCKHYRPGRRNDCEIPETDYIADREACNFCEYFEKKGHSSIKGNAKDASKEAFGRLFGEDPQISKEKPKSFDDFFK